MPATMTRSGDRWMINRRQIFESRAWQVHGGVMSVHFFGKQVSVTAAMVACAFWRLFGVAIPTAAQIETVVEYGYSDVWSCGPDTSTGQILCLYYDSYFVTSSPDEIAALDAGGLGSPYCCHWFRTSETFNVWSG